MPGRQAACSLVPQACAGSASLRSLTSSSSTAVKSATVSRFGWKRPGVRKKGHGDVEEERCVYN